MLKSEDYAYLKRNGRKFKMNREETIAAFERDGIPLNEMFIDFQTKFGGYCPEEDATIGIVKPLGKYMDGAGRFETREGVECVRCDIDSLIQIRYWLGEDGTFFYEDYIVAESFESYVRYSTYIHTVLEPLNWTFIDRERRDTVKYRKFLKDHEASILPDVSDRFHQIRRSDDLFWIVGTNDEQLYVRPGLLKGI